MTDTVEMPLWLLIVVGLLAAWVVLERLLLPSVRWFFRRRVNQVIAELNRRLPLRLPTFSLTKRQVLIDRLTSDPAVLEAIRAHCDETGKPWAVAAGEAEGYAREIVPAFNAWFYFYWGSAFCRWLVRRMYRVRLWRSEQRRLHEVPPKTTVVFVMNHRSNMDYVFVAYLAEKAAALSYAVGEWARIWPLKPLVRAMGGYFVRRRSNCALYRRVLERYVQMSVAGGVVQAVFPEGGLTRDGGFREPRLGLLDYMLRDHDPAGERDILFVPVALNYDRVIEDRSLVRGNLRLRGHRSAVHAIAGSLMLLSRGLRRRWRGEFYRLGYAAASFGTPLSARQWCRDHDLDFRELPRRRRILEVQRLANHLMDEIRAVIPVVPVALLCRVMLTDPGRTWSREALQSGCAEEIDRLRRNSRVCLLRRNPVYVVEAALRMLIVRRLVRERSDGYRMAKGEEVLLAFYANSIAHLSGSGGSA